MIQTATVAALATVVGAFLVLSGRDRRLIAAGLLLCLTASALTAPVMPNQLTITLRVVGGLLAAYLLLIATESPTIEIHGSAVGPLAEAALAGALFCVGWWAAPVAPLPGTLAAQAAGIALVGIAVVPLFGRDILRAGTAAAVLAIGASLLLQSWTGAVSAFEQLALTGLFVGIVGSTCLLLSPTPAVRFAQAIVATSPAATSSATSSPADGRELEPGGLSELPESPESPESPAEEKPAQSAESTRLRHSPRAERLRRRDIDDPRGTGR